jgi:hypothetical protein
MNWELPGGSGGLDERLGFLRAITRPYNGSWWVFPAAVGTAGRSVHPLMAWRAVLYALSMLARYQPACCTQHTITVPPQVAAVRPARKIGFVV